MTVAIRSQSAASSSSRAWARPLSDSPSPASIRASSATRSSPSTRRTTLAPFLSGAMHHQVHVGVGRDLRQVRHHDDLVGARQPGQPPPDLHRRPAADAGVDLVEHHGGARHRTPPAPLPAPASPGTARRRTRSWPAAAPSCRGARRSRTRPDRYRRRRHEPASPEGSVSAAGSSSLAGIGRHVMVNSASAIARPGQLAR